MISCFDWDVSSPQLCVIDPAYVGVSNMKAVSVAAVLLSVGTLFGCATTSHLEADAIDLDPERYTVDFENEKVRVIRIKYGPHERSVMHRHRDAVVINLTDDRVRMNYPDGSSEIVTAQAGDTGWAPAVEHLPENLTDEPVEVILVEVK